MSLQSAHPVTLMAFSRALPRIVFPVTQRTTSMLASSAGIAVPVTPLQAGCRPILITAVSPLPRDMRGLHAPIAIQMEYTGGSLQPVHHAIPTRLFTAGCSVQIAPNAIIRPTGMPRIRVPIPAVATATVSTMKMHPAGTAILSTFLQPPAPSATREAFLVETMVIRINLSM